MPTCNTRRRPIVLAHTDRLADCDAQLGNTLQLESPPLAVDRRARHHVSRSRRSNARAILVPLCSVLDLGGISTSAPGRSRPTRHHRMSFEQVRVFLVGILPSHNRGDRLLRPPRPPPSESRWASILVVSRLEWHSGVPCRCDSRRATSALDEYRLTERNRDACRKAPGTVPRDPLSALTADSGRPPCSPGNTSGTAAPSAAASRRP